MKLTVTTLSGELYMIEVGAEMELEGLKALCEFESGVPAREMVIMHEGRPLLDDKRSLKSHSIKEGDVLLIQHLMPPTNASTSSVELVLQSTVGSGATTNLPSPPSQVPVRHPFDLPVQLPLSVSLHLT
ncbi:hypothetical protein HPB50_011728 [Hyalomma asiaticum]|uniref:Uncharacterized protein n=1 Tax=Hyalomma asiaticum TaxID=266040 RepID=A0ACB7SE95_HYAAI|nr:hypothetical protein HPB50_011728 [Hyalomma asiaticum]